MNHKTQKRSIDLLIAISGFSVASISFWALGKFQIQEWILRAGVYAGLLAMLLYFLRLKMAAEGVDPDSRPAFREYLKLGSFYCFILFVMELPTILTVI